jgi:ribosomal protein S18 acetylase RimI-like enzyme
VKIRPVPIRAATPADAEAIADIHVRSWQAAYRGQLGDEYLDGLSASERVPRTRESLERPRSGWRTWVADEPPVIGFCTTGPEEDPDAESGTAEVYAIYLAPESYGKGIGRELFARAVEDLRGRRFASATLWVLEANEQARSFYLKAGWQLDGATTTERVDCQNLPTVRYRLDLS